MARKQSTSKQRLSRAVAEAMTFLDEEIQMSDDPRAVVQSFLDDFSSMYLRLTTQAVRWKHADMVAREAWLTAANLDLALASTSLAFFGTEKLEVILPIMEASTE